MFLSKHGSLSLAPEALAKLVRDYSDLQLPFALSEQLRTQWQWHLEALER
jgi:hypothetical protein